MENLYKLAAAACKAAHLAPRSYDNVMMDSSFSHLSNIYNFGDIDGFLCDSSDKQVSDIANANTENWRPSGGMRDQSTWIAYSIKSGDGAIYELFVDTLISPSAEPKIEPASIILTDRQQELTRELVNYVEPKPSCGNCEYYAVFRCSFLEGKLGLFNVEQNGSCDNYLEI